MHERVEILRVSVSREIPLGQELGQDIEAASRLAFGVAYAVLRNHGDAEDVAQEAVVRACERFPSLRERERFRAWLARIAWRLALDLRRSEGRRGRRERDVSGNPAVAPPTAEELLLSRELEAHVWAAIDALPEKLRLVVVLGSMQGHDVAEVAALLGLPEGTVKSRLHLARRSLAEKLRWIVSGTRKP